MSDDAAQRMVQEQVREAEKQIEELETPWEQRLAEQREKDEQERQLQAKTKLLADLRAPHLSNLHEDPQLSGKICHSLLGCTEGTPVHIGRHDGDPTP